MSDLCVFCEIVAGRAPATVVRQWADAVASVWHLHLHIVPRREDDGLALPWWSGRRTRAGGRP